MTEWLAICDDKAWKGPPPEGFEHLVETWEEHLLAYAEPNPQRVWWYDVINLPRSDLLNHKHPQTRSSSFIGDWICGMWFYIFLSNGFVSLVPHGVVTCWICLELQTPLHQGTSKMVTSRTSWTGSSVFCVAWLGVFLHSASLLVVRSISTRPKPMEGRGMDLGTIPPRGVEKMSWTFACSDSFGGKFKAEMVLREIFGCQSCERWGTHQ